MDQIIYRAGQEQVGAVATENGTLAPLYESQSYPTVLKTQAKRTVFRSNMSGSNKMLEDASKKSKWSWNSHNSKLGDQFGVGGQKLKLSNIGVELPLQNDSNVQTFGFVSFYVFLHCLLCFSFIHGFFHYCECGGDEMAQISFQT